MVQFGSVTTAGCKAGSSACTNFTAPASASNYTQTATITLDPSFQNASGITALFAHEIGHTYAFMECDGCGSSTTIMDGSNMTESSPTSPQACDKQVFAQIRQGKWKSGNGSGGGTGGGSSAVCDTTPITCPAGSGIAECDPTYGWHCSDQCVGTTPQPCCDECYEMCSDGQWVCVGSPIIIDVFGTGFHLSDIHHGVQFRVLPKQD